MASNESQNKKIIIRLEKLEAVVFGDGKTSKKIKKDSSFRGPKGGCQLILSKGFFNKKRAVDETKKELEKYDYYYSRDAIQTALNRMSKNNGLLVSLKGKPKMYVKRK
ncbi:MAG: hypothetical protein WC675_03285 [Patescibacteria group bacterium]|jgi:hypothetical protein